MRNQKAYVRSLLLMLAMSLSVAAHADFNPTNPPEPDLRLDVTVTVLSADTLLGTVSGGGTYPFATVDTITATPIPGYSFLYWQDGTPMILW